MVITASTIEQKSSHTASYDELSFERGFHLGTVFSLHDEILYPVNRTQIHGSLQVLLSTWTADMRQTL
jgi:hypothetical protein